MAPLAQQLNEVGQVILDGSGNGTLRMRPDSSREHWLPTLASIKASSNTSEATCKIYIGAAATDDNFVDGTLSGSTGDATSKVTGYDISRTRDPYIFAVWAGGDPGATATMIINGTKEIR